MEQKLQEEIINTLAEIRDTHYDIMLTIKRRDMHNATIEYLADEVFEKMIDVLDVFMNGSDPKAITAGIWDKWTRN